MTELLDKAISLTAWLRYAELKKLPDGKQNEVAMMIFNRVSEKSTSSSLALRD